MPPFLYKGVEAILIALRKWTKKQDEYAKYHKLQVPLELNPQKLIKSLEKELKVDSVSEIEFDLTLHLER